MATVNTWTLLIQGVTFAATTVLAGIRNGGARVIRVRRIGMVNAQTAAVAGVICATDIVRYWNAVTWNAPTAVAAVPHDTGNSALVATTTGRAGNAVGGSGPDTFRRLHWNSDEPVYSTSTMDDWEIFVPLGIIWDAGYGDDSSQSITLRNGELIFVYNQVGAVGLVDVWIEFTDEAA